jgi:hypothetical protein
MGEARLKDIIEKRIEKQSSGCWNWKGAMRAGYGCVKVKGKIISAHRYFYSMFKGDIPDSMLILHNCDNKLCVNPDHLRLGTYKENFEDAVERGQAKGVLDRQKKPVKHPSKTSYNNGCRCDLCKAAKAESMRKYRMKK